jgi:hypothetical protein
MLRSGRDAGRRGERTERRGRRRRGAATPRPLVLAERLHSAVSGQRTLVCSPPPAAH